MGTINKRTTKWIFAVILAVAFLMSGSFVLNLTPKKAQAGAPQKAAELPVVSAGDNHSLALDTDGGLWAWGGNNNGQLGDGTDVDKNTPVKITAGGGTVTEFSAVSAGEIHSLAIDADGGLWAWGGNNNGQLGDETYADKNTPVKITAGGGTVTEFSAVSAGDRHSLAIDTDGGLWAWGYNGHVQLGDGTDVDKNTPVKITAGGGTVTEFSAVSAGALHSLAIDVGGGLWAWGYNFFGQLGDGTNADKNIPVKITADNGAVTEFSAVSAGGSHSLAIDAGGGLWAWGWNSYYGQLGDGTYADKNTPVKITAGGGTVTEFSAVSAGALHSLAIDVGGGLWAWGYNFFGQLGDGANADKNTPVKIKNGTAFAAVSAGGSHSLAVDANGGMWAWGNNIYGWLGDGTYTAKNTPVKIHKINTYIVIFYDYDGTSVLKTQTGIEHGSAATAPFNPDNKEGWHFDHWDKVFSNVTENLDVIAVYAINTYIVKFYDYDGTFVIKTQAGVEHGSAATAPSNPDNKTGWHFTGWDKAFDNVTENLNITAVYAINTYIVKFKDYDGTVLKTQPNIEHGSAVTAPFNPNNKTGWHFTGWDKTFNNVTENLDVIAVYAINTYTVTFYDYDGTTVLKTQTGVEYGSAATAPTNPDNKEGWHFTGWDKTFNNVTENLDVIAVYAINTYTVTFYDYDGTTVLKTQTGVKHGSAATAPTNPDNKTGWHFTGWDKTFNNVTSNLDVTAVYAINTYTVTFYDYDGTTVLKTQTGIEYGSAAAAPSNPNNKTGWHFTGWDKTFNNVTGNLEITAVYAINAINTYIVTVTGGTGGGNYEAGATVSITANAAPTDKIFDKWTTSDGVIFSNANSAVTTFTMPAKAVTVTAAYKNISAGTDTYTVTEQFGAWDGNGGATAKINADYNDFIKLTLNGAPVAASNYTVTSGSTVITLKESYLKTLSNGNHNFIAEFADGVSGSISLTVSNNNNNTGGISSEVITGIVIGLIALVGCFAIYWFVIKKRTLKDLLAKNSAKNTRYIIFIITAFVLSALGAAGLVLGLYFPEILGAFSQTASIIGLVSAAAAILFALFAYKNSNTKAQGIIAWISAFTAIIIIVIIALFVFILTLIFGGDSNAKNEAKKEEEIDQKSPSNKEYRVSGGEIMDTAGNSVGHCRNGSIYKGTEYVGKYKDGKIYEHGSDYSIGSYGDGKIYKYGSDNNIGKYSGDDEDKAAAKAAIKLGLMD